MLLAMSGPASAMHRYVKRSPAPRTPRYTHSSSRATHRSTRHGRLRRTAWNPMFKPSRDSLLKQNEEIDRLELPRIQDDDELRRLKESEDLVPIFETESLRIDPKLDPERRFCRPWTLDFLSDLSDAYYERFRDQIQVNSAVRTVLVQRRLRRHNRNAAPESGEIASSHLAGITVDIQRRGMTREQVKWVEQFMSPLHDQGLIEPEEERHQWVFHVMVSGRYSEWRDQQLTKDETPAESPAAEVPASADVAVPER
jgi:hypothetical protein